MKSINTIIIFSTLLLALTSCGAFTSKPTETPAPSVTKLPTLILSTTPSLTPLQTLANTPTLTPAPSCIDVEIFVPMTESQIKYLQNNTYNFLYATDEKSIDNVYSLNRADTVCSPGYYSTNSYDVWKVVSGFLVDLKQPDKSLYYPGGENTAGGKFVNIYAKARFISQDGQAHDYWLQLTGNPPNYWFQLARWGKPISESKNLSGLTAMDILATEKNSDDTTSYLDANTMIPDGFLKVNDQFVAILHVGYTTNDKGFTTNELLKQFVNAFEGKAEFPIVPDGFFLSVQAMIVPSKP